MSAEYRPEHRAEPRRIGVPAAVALGVLLALGLTLSGWLVGRGFIVSRAITADAARFVTVKGLAEREVDADLVLWPIVFTATGNDLSRVQGELDADAAEVKRFLADRGFGDEESEISAPRVQDYGPPRPNGPAERYSVEATVTVRSGKIVEVQEAMQASGELIKAGVAMIRSYEYQPEFLYTALETVKPDMIAEATRDARRAAEQFAQDSGARVGSIRSAQQGYFSIQDRDRFSPEVKKIRVVTTIEYLLEGG